MMPTVDAATKRRRRLDGIGMTSRRTRERLIARLREKGAADETVLAVMAEVPRHLFVDEALASRAYDDTALPAGHDQTISQPFVVALMTQLLLNGRRRLGRVLEVGTGTGYQTAILAHCCDKVFSVERIGALLRPAQERLSELRLRNVRFANRDGFDGWPAHAPYDGILVTAAPPAVPPGLTAQLADGGRLVLPVGPADGVQRLCVHTRTGGRIGKERRGDVAFVPLRKGIA